MRVVAQRRFARPASGGEAACLTDAARESWSLSCCWMLVVAVGRQRPSGHRRGRPPPNKGMRHPADPADDRGDRDRHACGWRSCARLCLRGLIVVLWRAGVRISEALALMESDLDPARGAILARHGKGDKRCEVGIDQWGWNQLGPWLSLRLERPVGALFCVIDRASPSRGAPASRGPNRARIVDSIAIPLRPGRSAARRHKAHDQPEPGALSTAFG